MEITLRESEEYIKLGQLMKKAGLVGAGSDAKMLIEDGLVTVNGEVETRRGRKLFIGDMVSFDGETVTVVES